MKTIGLIGGTGWISTLEYYRLINEITNRRLGGSNASKCIIHSFNFEEIIKLHEKNETGIVYSMIADAARNLINSGAACIALCANTMHKYAERLNNEIGVPIVHIAEAIAMAIKNSGIARIGLLGTMLTMELDFYTTVLKNNGITTLIPAKPERDYIQSCIFNELIKVVFKEESRNRFIEIIDHLKQKGAEGVILGCTEIPLLIQQHHVDLPLFNTLEIHANAIVDFALNEKEN